MNRLSFAVFFLILGNSFTQVWRSDDLAKEIHFQTNHCTKSPELANKEIAETSSSSQINFSNEAFRVSITSIISRKLVKVTQDTINVRILMDQPAKEILGHFIIKGKHVHSVAGDNQVSRTDVILKYVKYKENGNLEVGFRSFGGGGMEYSGDIILKWEEGTYKFEKIHYISSIE